MFELLVPVLCGDRIERFQRGHRSRHGGRGIYLARDNYRCFIVLCREVVEVGYALFEGLGWK